MKKGNLYRVPIINNLAESEGFKPPIPEKGIPDFESSAIDHSANSPSKRTPTSNTRLAEREESQSGLNSPSKRIFLRVLANAKVLHYYETTKLICK